MPRKYKSIPGQLNLQSLFATPMSLKEEHWVVQSNSLITGRQALKLNSAKLIRAAIMQIKPDDEELKPYLVSIPQLAELLNTDRSDLFRDIDRITDDITQNPVFIKNVESGKFKKIPWVTVCEYDPVIGVTIQLNDKLKPFLLALQQKYTQYRLETILDMRSVYAIRLFELIQERIKRTIPQKGIDVELSVDDIRIACDCTEKYKEFKHFRERVIDAGEKEINRATLYNLTHEFIKNGRQVVAIRFHVEYL